MWGLTITCSRCGTNRSRRSMQEVGGQPVCVYCLRQAGVIQALLADTLRRHQHEVDAVKSDRVKTMLGTVKGK